MWAYELVGPDDFQLVQCPAPDGGSLGNGQLIVRLQVGGICGSDIPYFHGIPGTWFPPASWPAPTGLPLHEIVGEVVTTRCDIPVGSQVVGWAAGNQGLAEFVVADGDRLFALEPALDPANAIMIQPLACVLYALSRLPDVAHRRVAVLGLGSIGVLFTHAMKAAGASHVTGVDQVDRTGLADVFGVDEVVHASAQEWASSLDDAAERPSVVIEAIGHRDGTLNDAVAAIAPHGYIYYFGVPDNDAYSFALESFMRKDLVLLSGTTHRRREFLERARAHLSRHDTLSRNYVTNVLPIGRAQEAFTRASRPTPGQLKIVLDAHAEPADVLARPNPTLT